MRAISSFAIKFVRHDWRGVLTLVKIFVRVTSEKVGNAEWQWRSVRVSVSVTKWSRSYVSDTARNITSLSTGILSNLCSKDFIYAYSRLFASFASVISCRECRVSLRAIVLMHRLTSIIANIFFETNIERTLWISCLSVLVYKYTSVSDYIVSASKSIERSKSIKE